MSHPTLTDPHTKHSLQAFVPKAGFELQATDLYSPRDDPTEGATETVAAVGFGAALRSVVTEGLVSVLTGRVDCVLVVPVEILVDPGRSAAEAVDTESIVVRRRIVRAFLIMSEELECKKLVKKHSIISVCFVKKKLV